MKRNDIFQLLQFGISEKSYVWWKECFQRLIDTNSLGTKVQTKQRRRRKNEEVSSDNTDLVEVNMVLTGILEKVTEMDGNGEMMTEDTKDLVVDEIPSASHEEVDLPDNQTNVQAERETEVDSLKEKSLDVSTHGKLYSDINGTGPF